MGAGNWLPKGDYLDSKGYYVDYGGIYGDDYYTNGFQDSGEIDDFIENLTYGFLNKFKTIDICNEWLNREDRAILSDDIIKVVVGDNENSAAVYVVMCEPEYEEDYTSSEMEDIRGRFDSYVEYLREILLLYYTGNILERTGPWTSCKVN